MVGKRHLIDAMEPYYVDEGVQLICKYLKANKEGTIDKEYVEGNTNISIL